MSSYNGKVVLVTGAGSGMGLAAANAFAQQGASVVLAGRRKEVLDKAVAGIIQAGHKAFAVTADVSKEEDVKQLVAATLNQFGHLDAAFNNAGIEQPDHELIDLPTDLFDKVIAIDLRGVFLSMKYEIPAMLKNGAGAIVNTSSGAGVRGFPKIAAYNAAKWGLIGMSKSAALDYADKNIRVNVVAPGMIDTPMMGRFTGGTAEGRAAAIAQEPIGRAGKAEEIADSVLYLCSDAASFVTGEVLVADGGQTV